MTRWCLLFTAAALAFGSTVRAVDPPASGNAKVKPLKVLLITGGCCHDYKKQKDLLKTGLEARAQVVVDLMHSDDTSTKCRFEKLAKADWADGYDVVIHDECSADVKDIDYVLSILNAHRKGVPAVNLHCAMHSYRVSPDFGKATLKPGTEASLWFDFTGIQSTGHGPQLPIDLKFVAADHPITKGMKDWTTIKEELYNNIQVFEGITPLIRGKQADKETVVAWTNLYGERKTRVFSTTVGHNNDTVADDRYLNLVTRGVLWACDKLNDDYLKKFDPNVKPVEGPQPTPAKPKEEPKKEEPKKTSAVEKSTAKPVAGLKAPAGFETTLFAGPPNVNYPTCLSTTPEGVVYVGCDENGSLDAKPNRGRIVRCIDQDGDGVADDFTIFAKMDSPRGVIVDGATVYVLHPPQLTAYIDTNGDGVADREETLIDGIGFDLKFRGADHTTNGIRLGIDGFIYVAVGDYGFIKAKGKDGTTLQMHGGGVARVRTDGTGFEIVSNGQRNIYDVAVDPWLNLFTRDNTNDGGGWDVRLSHVVCGANFGYPRLFKNFNDEIAQPLADYGGGSPTGALFVDEGALPEPYRRSLLTVEWGRSGVMRHPLTAKGATYTAGQEKFLDLARPTDIDVDAAGRFYVASWKDGGFNYSGPNIGYVARVAQPNVDGKKVPVVEKANETELVQLIGGESHALRMAAQRELLRRADWQPNTVSGLQQIVTKPGDTAPRVAAMYTLSQKLGANAEAQLLGWTKNDDLREFALRALGERRREWSALSPQPLVAALSDPNPRVRLQAVTALVRLKHFEMAGAMVPLVADPDPIVAHVTRNGLTALKAVQPLLAGMDRGPTPVTLGCLKSLQIIHEPATVTGLAERLTKATDPTLKKAILTALCRLSNREADWDSKWWGTRPDTTGPYFKSVAWEKTSEIQEVLGLSFANAEAELRLWLLKETNRHRLELRGAMEALLKMAKEDKPSRADAARLIAGLPNWSDDAVQLLVTVAEDAEQLPKVREEVLSQLIKRSNVPAAKQGAFAAVATLGTKSTGSLRQIRTEYVNSLANAGQLKTLLDITGKDRPAERELAYAALLKLTQQPKAPADAKQSATKALGAAWAKPDTTAELLRSIGATGADQFAYQVSQYRKSEDETIRKAAEFAAAELRLDEQGKNKITIASLKYEDVLAQAEKLKGDVTLGGKLFLFQGCANCHTTLASEQPKGPFLGGISARYKRPELCESILKPSAKIAQGFDTHVFILDDGKVVDGFITKESGLDVELRGQNGAPLTISKEHIEQRKKSDQSVMPTGLADKLSAEELAAILAYLESLPAK